MPWSYRKSIKAGPFRVNLSKSGVGYSVGGKALRYGKTAKGRSYISSAPVPGLRYQQTLSTPASRGKQTPTLPLAPGPMSPAPQRMPQGRLGLIIAGAVVCLFVILGLVGAATKGNATPTVATRPATATIPATVAVAPALVATAIPTTRPASVVATPTPLASTATSALPPPQSVTVTAASAVNVRSGPDTEAEVLSQVLPGNDATVIDEDVPSDFDDTHWVHVSVNGMEGYIRNDLVSDPHIVAALVQSPAVTPVPAPTATFATPTALRSVTLTTSAPTSTAPILASPLPTGTAVPAAATATMAAPVYPTPVPAATAYYSTPRPATVDAPSTTIARSFDATSTVIERTYTSAISRINATSTAETRQYSATMTAIAKEYSVPSGASGPSGGSSGGCVSNCTVSVSGYFRRDGTYVQPYVRSPPGTRSHK